MVAASFAGPVERSARAAHCPPVISAEAGLAELDPERRLDWIDQHLAVARTRALAWSWAWGLGIGASGVASLVVAPFDDPANRVDWYTSAASAAVGVVPLVVAPLAVIRDAREL